MTVRGENHALTLRVRMAGEDRDLYGTATRPASQVVAKSISCAKSRDTAREMALYIARWRLEDDRRRHHEGVDDGVVLYDEAGMPVERSTEGNRKGHAALKRILDNWDILPESKNQARLGDDVSDADRAAMPEQHRLDRREVEHFTWSVRREDIPDGRDARQVMEDITREIVRETFAEPGHSALWAVHLEHPKENGHPMEGSEPKHPHAHILVRSRAADGTRLQVNRTFLDAFRAICARHANTFGVRVSATRREDRRAVRERILNGEERLRTSRRRPQARRGIGHLADRAPNYWRRHGAAIEARRERLRSLQREAADAGISGAERWSWVDSRMPQAGTATLPEVPGIGKDAQVLREGFTAAYADPDEALKNFLQLAAELKDRQSSTDTRPGKSLAAWYLLNQPIVFGNVTPKARRLRLDPRLTLAANRICASADQLRIALDALKGLDETESDSGVRFPEQTSVRRPTAHGIEMDRREMSTSLRVLAERADRIIYQRAPGEDLGYDVPTDQIRREANALLPRTHATELAPEERPAPRPGAERDGPVRPRTPRTVNRDGGSDGRSR